MVLYLVLCLCLAVQCGRYQVGLFSLEIVSTLALFCFFRSAFCRLQLSIAISLALDSSLAGLMATSFFFNQLGRCIVFAVASAYVVGASLAKWAVFCFTGLDTFTILVCVPVQASGGFGVNFVSLIVREYCWWIVVKSMPRDVWLIVGPPSEMQHLSW